MPKPIITKCVILFALVLSGCQTATHHRDLVSGDKSEKTLTVGKVQREIRVGMTNAQVAEILGSPNVVSTDEQRREVWIYDKIATETATSSNQGGVNVLILGIGGGSGASSTTQRTLTVIVKFDADSKVRDFAYHTSRF